MSSTSNADIRILVVDDTAENRRLYGAILRDLGAEVFEAASGEEALTLGAAREYAMILLDVHLTGLSGFETARKIRENPCCAHTPIVFVSAVYTTSADAFAGYGSGAVDYIVAPIVPEILRAKARVFIDLLRMRRDVEAVNCALRAANAELESFGHTAAHDLKGPLQHIAAYAQAVLRLELGASAQAQNYLQRIEASAKQLAELIDDMLALASITRRELRRETLDLTALASEVLSELLSAGPPRRVEWQPQAGLVAQADAGMLRILLTNLLSNACKFTGKLENARIAFGQREVGGERAYFVSDNGAGFDQQLAAGKLFRPFQRMHSQETFPGTGVGLATVERVVRRHGGRVWAESAPGQGTTVFFTLG